MSSVNHSFIQMTKLSDVKGRIRYISDPKRQENLYATLMEMYRRNIGSSWQNKIIEILKKAEQKEVVLKQEN